MARTQQPAATPEVDRDQVDFSWATRWLERGKDTRVGRRLSQALPWPERPVAVVGGIVVAVVLALWLTAGAWGPRPPSGEDTIAHLARADFAIHHLILHGRIDGWDPTWILGYQEFLFIGPAFTWAVFAVRTLTFNALSVTGAFKVVMIASYVALPLTVAFFARSIGLGRRASSLAAILTLAVNNPFGGVGLQGMFNVGLVVHEFGALLFFLSLGGILRVLERPRLRWALFTSAALGGLLMAHGISVIVLGAMLAIIVPLAMVKLSTPEQRQAALAALIRREVRSELAAAGVTPAASNGPDPSRPLATTPIDRESFRVLLWVGLGAAALAACTFLPFLMHRDLRGGFTDWATPPLGERFVQIWRGEILFRPGVAMLVVAGLAYAAYRVYEGRRFALAVLAGPVAYLIVAHIALHQWPNVATDQLDNRGLGYVGVLAMLPLAALIARATKRSGKAGDLVAVVACAAIVLVPLGNTRSLARQMDQPVPEMVEAAHQLARVVPDGARFVTERDFPEEITRTKVVNPDRWLAWASGRWTLNNFNVESSQTGDAAFQSEHIRDRTPDAIADAVSRLGVTHLVTLSDAATLKMISSPRFHLVWGSPIVSIFAVVPKSGQPDPSALVTAPVPLTAHLTHPAAEHLAMEVEPSAPAALDVAVGWSPKWHAAVDGHSVAIHRAADGLIQVQVPAGQHRLSLDYRQDVWDYLGLLITLATVAFGIRLIWLRLRRRSGRGRARPFAMPFATTRRPRRSRVEQPALHGDDGGLDS